MAPTAAVDASRDDRGIPLLAVAVGHLLTRHLRPSHDAVMNTEERTDGPTPNDGEYAIAYWHAADGSPTDKANAAERAECDKQAWLAVYRNRHGKVGPTRKRIELLFDAPRPHRVLKNNVFSLPSVREVGLDKTKRQTAVFDFLLETLRPRLVFVHGRTAVKHLERITKTTLPHGKFIPVRYAGAEFEIFTGKHLAYQWKGEEVKWGPL